MSFSQKTKNELARIIPKDKCCQLAELAALIRMDGSIHISADHHMSLGIETQNAAVARKMYFLGKTLFNLKEEVSVRRNNRLRKNVIYSVKMVPQPGTKKALDKLGIDFTPAGYKIHWNSELVKKRCCQKAYLRGAFLGGGSISNPEQKTYHLEIITSDSFNDELISELMRNFNIEPKTTWRKKAHVIYLKDSEMIVDFLNVVGAHCALLNFENIRVHKDVRNRVNRIVNCETANLNKTVEAGLKQVETIRYLERSIGLENLPVGLKEIARARLENPEVSLKELGETMEPPLSKSGVNHRMRRLKRIADKLRGKSS